MITVKFFISLVAKQRPSINKTNYFFQLFVIVSLYQKTTAAI